MTEKNYDDILRKGLIDYKNIEFASVPPEEEICHVFSEKYEKSKAKLIEKIDKPLWKYTNTVAKRVAIIILCFVLATASLLSVEAVREKIVKFFYTVFDTHTTVGSNDNNRKSIEEIYFIKNIPENYMLKSEDFTDIDIFFLLENTKNQFIILQQSIFNISQNLNSENVTPLENVVNGTPCFFVEQDYAYIYYWEFDGYSFTLSYPLDLGEEFAESVIGKLVEIET